MDTIVKTTKNIGTFLNTVIKKTILPYASPYIAKKYRAAVQAVDASWDPVHIKETLLDTWSNTVEPSLPAHVKQAWAAAFTDPTIDATVFARFREWVVASVRDVNYEVILRTQITNSVDNVNSVGGEDCQHSKSKAASFVDAFARWLAAMIDQVIQLVARVVAEVENVLAGCSRGCSKVVKLFH